jgi:aldehyde:ferredoxin oxidoreductase
MDPISFGATVGAVMELYDLGVLSKEQIGLEAPFGSAEGPGQLAEMTAKGEGFGKELGQGSKRLCAKYGRPELSMTVKGQEFPAYDGRGIQGMGLAYATSNRGACHLRGYTVASEVFGIPVKTDPLVTAGKPGCWSRPSRMPPPSSIPPASACSPPSPGRWPTCSRRFRPPAKATGRWKAAGGRAHLEHGTRVQPGRRDSPARTTTLPPRLLTEPAKTGPAKGLVSRHRQDAARVLQPARLDAGRRADRRDTLERLGL